MPSNEKHNEAWEECSQFYQKTHVPIKEVLESIDKLLDKINKLKSVNNHIYNHFKNSVDINGQKLEKIYEKKVNIKKIIDLIEEQRKTEIK